MTTHNDPAHSNLDALFRTIDMWKQKKNAEQKILKIISLLNISDSIFKTDIRANPAGPNQSCLLFRSRQNNI